MDITLERDGHDQPWGFRLQGGSDVGMPLSIQRVLVGTPAEGVLRKGDILLKISRTDARGITHQQAADLFTNVGNQISIQIKRSGGSQSQGSVPAVPTAPPQPLPIKQASPAGKSPSSLHFNRGGTHHSTSAPLSLTIQNQPYRTSPLIQPSAKADLGVGSTQHLKLQADYITGAKEAIPALDPRATEFTMKQKMYKPLQRVTTKIFAPQTGWKSRQVTGTLQQIQQSTPPPPVSVSPVPMQSQVPAKQFYNNPINLYSAENVAEVAKLNKMGVSGVSSASGEEPVTSPSGLLHPVNKPPKPWLNAGGLPRKYDPEQSATWQAIHETENCQLVTEHGPTESKVYSI